LLSCLQEVHQLVPERGSWAVCTRFLRLALAYVVFDRVDARHFVLLSLRLATLPQGTLRHQTLLARELRVHCSTSLQYQRSCKVLMVGQLLEGVPEVEVVSTSLLPLSANNRLDGSPLGVGVEHVFEHCSLHVQPVDERTAVRSLLLHPRPKTLVFFSRSLRLLLQFFGGAPAFL